MLYTEFSACIACGLDLEKWVNGGYDNTLKAYAIAYYKLKNAVEAHTQDASIAQMKHKR